MEFTRHDVSRHTQNLIIAYLPPNDSLRPSCEKHRKICQIPARTVLLLASLRRTSVSSVKHKYDKLFRVMHFLRGGVVTEAAHNLVHDVPLFAVRPANLTPRTNVTITSREARCEQMKREDSPKPTSQLSCVTPGCGGVLQSHNRHETCHKGAICQICLNPKLIGKVPHSRACNATAGSVSLPPHPKCHCHMPNSRSTKTVSGL